MFDELGQILVLEGEALLLVHDVENEAPLVPLVLCLLFGLSKSLLRVYVPLIVAHIVLSLC
jgi:hypothetical protein